MLTLGLERAGQYSAGLVEQWYAELLSAYGDALDVHTVMYPGAMDAVELLKSNGMAVGICTNKPEGLAETLMTRLGVRDAFGSLIGADTLPTRKPDAAPYIAAVERAGGVVAQSCLIGDTKTDRDTARAVGVACVLVGFGPSGEDMAALEPDALGHFIQVFAEHGAAGVIGTEISVYEPLAAFVAEEFFREFLGDLPH